MSEEKKKVSKRQQVQDELGRAHNAAKHRARLYYVLGKLTGDEPYFVRAVVCATLLSTARAYMPADRAGQEKVKILMESEEGA